MSRPFEEILFASLFIHIFTLDNGVNGYSTKNIRDNWEPSSGQTMLSLFQVFGVFFPAATGVMAGINMSGDLFEPDKNIPTGTFSAIGTSLLLYLSFAFGLAATCVRSALLEDYMIEQKASAVGFFLLTGLFISSLSYSLGSLYASPRIIQNISNENIIPAMRMFAVGRGPNKGQDRLHSCNTLMQATGLNKIPRGYFGPGGFFWPEVSF